MPRPWNDISPNLTTWMRRLANDFGPVFGPFKSRPRAAYHGLDIAPEHLNRLKAMTLIRASDLGSPLTATPLSPASISRYSDPMNLLRAITTVGGYTMLSRVLGFARDILIAAVLGAVSVADTFFVAFRFPDLFRRLFAEGAFAAAFIPIFSSILGARGA